MITSACRACDYVYIDYVRRSRSSSCRLLRPINCQTYITLHYITSQYMHKGAKIPSTLPGMNVPWVLKFQGTKVLYMDFLLPGAKSLGSEKSRYAYLYSAPLNRYTCYGAIEVVAIIIIIIVIIP